MERHRARSWSRRRALALGAPLGLSAAGVALAGLNARPRIAPGGAGAEPPRSIDAAALALLAESRVCRPIAQAAQGPYWFDVDRLRGDIRENRPGVPLRLVFRVVDGAGCANRPVPDAVVEVWHCDATGRYSGFETPGGPVGPTPPPGWPNDRGGEPPAADPTGDPMGYSSRTSDGSYARGDAEAQPADDGTFLRGAQIADPQGIVRFATIYPGWYVGRAPHVHVKVHLNRRTALATQVFFDDAVSDRIYAAAPYRPRRALGTRNASDALYTEAAQLTLRTFGDARIGAINLGVDLLGVPRAASGSTLP
ncbi:protocatechuate dioxygenase [Cryptosporangium sp. NPDC051539]|uniref:protocatechuate dioxygenase n=1 Tax=Cryptosporangium sp. NPDC051539 TaxID=3363962 RepID=UPI0037B31A2A